LKFITPCLIIVCCALVAKESKKTRIEIPLRAQEALLHASGLQNSLRKQGLKQNFFPLRGKTFTKNAYAKTFLRKSFIKNAYAIAPQKPAQY